MKRLRLYYFSGTGNARRVALWMAEEARQLGADARAHSIDFGALPEIPEPGDHIGFVFPVHGFTTIAAMLDFVWNFPPGNRSVSVFAAAVTGGCRIGPMKLPGWEGSGLYLPLLLLRLKGYRCVGALPLRSTPENWTALVPACPDSACRSLLCETHAAPGPFIGRLLAGQCAFRGRVSLLFGIAALPVSVLYFCFARYFLAKLFFATSRCNACGLCAQGCPVSAIRMVRGRPFWTLRCESCMRCINFCPQQAIQASQLLAALAILCGSGVLTKPSAALLQSQFAISEGPAAGLAWLLSLPAMIGILVLFYRVWSTLLRWKPINRFFEYTTLTRWYRRYREPDTHWRDIAGSRQNRWTRVASSRLRKRNS